MTLRLPDELHSLLKVAAGEAGRSLHGEVLWRLRNGGALVGARREDEDVTPVREQGSSPRVPASACSRSMFHRKGEFCKACGRMQ